MTDTEYITKFAEELKTLLIFRGFDISDDKATEFILTSEIKRAIREINRCRRFKPTDKKPYDKKYEDMIVPLAVKSFAKIGADGQTSHSENGINRNYTSGGDYPKDMLNEIIPLIK